MTEAVARRAAQRLRPFRLSAAAVSVEVRACRTRHRAAATLRPALADETEIAALVRTLAEPLLEPAEGVRGLLVRLSKLETSSAQAALFPESPLLRRAR